MKQVLEGSHAVSEAVRLARVAVMSAYPITPQTHIVEALSAFCADGRMDARFICVESEHSALAAVIAEGRAVTYDLKPSRDDPSAVGTREMADAIIARLPGSA